MVPVLLLFRCDLASGGLFEKYRETDVESNSLSRKETLWREMVEEVLLAILIEKFIVVAFAYLASFPL